MGQVTFGKQSESGKIAKNYSEIVALKSQMKAFEEKLDKRLGADPKEVNDIDLIVRLEDLRQEIKLERKTQTNVILAAVSVATAVITLLEVLL